MSRLGKSALITILAGALSFLSSAPTTSKFADPKPQPPLISYQQLLSEKPLPNKPDVYLVLLNHPQELIGNMMFKENNNCMEEVARITQTLYEKYNSRSLLPEGIEPGTAEIFEKKGKITLGISEEENPTGRFFKTLENLINSRKWNLFVGDKEQARAKYIDLKAQLSAVYSPILLKADKEADNTKKEDIPALEKRTEEKLKQAWEGFFTPQVTAQLYRMGVTDRDRSYAEVCRNAKQEGRTPITVIYGSAHISTFREQLEKRGLNYLIVKPESIDKVDPITPEGFKKRHLILGVKFDKKR